MSKYSKINRLIRNKFICSVFRRLEWKSYQIHLENQIAENHKALNRKEQYIKNQDYVIENLTQEKLSLETRLNNPVLELQSNRSEEIEKYQKEIRQLSAIIADTEKTLEATKESYNIEMSEMRYIFITKNSAYCNN